MNREKNWHGLSVADLERVFRTDSAKGLSEKEAARRLRHGKNTVWEIKTTSAGRYALRSFFDLTTVLLVITVLCLGIFSKGDMALCICILLAIGRTARIGAYIWAERVFEENAKESLPRAKVVRGGNVRVVASENVAPGDVLILDSGDTVPCDIRLTAADNISVAEGGVTGSEAIVSKSSEIVGGEKGADVPFSKRTNMVYAGSVVIEGFAIGIAVATGDDTLICKREGRTVLAGENDIATVEKLSDWGRIASLCLIGAALIITLAAMFFGGGSLADSFLPSVAMAAAGLSEYIAAVGAFAWAKKLRESNDCVLSNASVGASLANTEILVLRSTEILKSKKITLHSHFTEDKLTMMGTKDAKAPVRLLRLCCYCTGASPEGAIARGSFGVRQSAEGVLPYRLIRSLWEENRTDSEGDTYTIVQHLPAGDVYAGGLDSVLLADGNEFFFAAMGPVERVLALSNYKIKDGERVPLTESDRRSIRAYADELCRRGVTLCAVGFRPSHYNNLRRVSVLQSSLTFEGFIAVADRCEETVVPFISDFRERGGRVVIFSERGEDDRFYAQSEDVFRVGDRYYNMKETAVANVLSLDSGNLCMMETPAGADGVRERLRVLNILMKTDANVTYVGYGVEDMWNMKRAGVSIATPGPAGVIFQGTRNAAHAVVRETSGGGFSAAVSLMERCRRTMLNIRSILKYLIVSHVARLILMLLAAALGLPLPSAGGLVFWGVILDFAVSFATATAHGADVKLRAGRVTLSPDSKRAVIVPTAYGAFLAVLSVAVPLVGKILMARAGFALDVTAEALTTCAALGCMVAMPFVGAEYAGGRGLFSKQSKLGLWYIIPFALAILISAAILIIPPVRAAFGAAFPGWMMSALTLVPSVVMVVVMSVVRAVKNKDLKR
ncbi:MAG: cation-transporting P-type ATPase [Clostridia bacterium]|nr:cation-transporting P-type ATPase [Clostridia bacterium]